MAQVVATERGITGAIVIDLDNFKLVNDGLGHEQGDTALRATADRLRETVGGDGFTARLGGDEFAVLLQNLPDADAANQVAARICEALAIPMSIGGSHVSCSASAGVADNDRPERPGPAATRHADLALYAGQGGGPRSLAPLRAGDDERGACIGSICTRRSSARLTTTELTSRVPADRRARERPYGRLRGSAALDHPYPRTADARRVHRCGRGRWRIIRIGRWVPLGAMAAAVRWTDVSRESIPYVAVNVSPSQFRSTGFARRCLPHVRGGNLPPPD